MRAIIVTAVLLACAGEAGAGPIERACLKAGRTAASPLLCDCIQGVADDTLKRRDQRRAARFFEDPHRAQIMRQSDRRSHEAFWLRYKHFGSTAQAHCAAAHPAS